jgi:hypothetical protein
MGMPISASSLGASPSRSILMISVVQVPIQTITEGLRSRLNLLTQPLQLFVVVELGRNIPFFQLGHGIARFGKNHHPHGVLQEIATGFGTNDQKEAIFNFLVQPGYTANRAKGVVIAGIAVKFEGLGLRLGKGHDSLSRMGWTLLPGSIVLPSTDAGAVFISMLHRLEIRLR